MYWALLIPCLAFSAVTLQQSAVQAQSFLERRIQQRMEQRLEERRREEAFQAGHRCAERAQTYSAGPSGNVVLKLAADGIGVSESQLDWTIWSVTEDVALDGTCSKRKRAFLKTALPRLLLILEKNARVALKFGGTASAWQQVADLSPAAAAKKTLALAWAFLLCGNPRAMMTTIPAPAAA